MVNDQRQKVTALTRAEWAAVEYVDGHGARHTVTVMIAGSKVFLPRDSEAWTKELREASGWFREAVLAGLARGEERTSPEVPKMDVVDVLPGGT